MIQLGTLVRINDVGAHNADMVGVNDGDFGIVVALWEEVGEPDGLYDILVSGCTLVPYLRPQEFDVVA